MQWTATKGVGFRRGIQWPWLTRGSFASQVAVVAGGTALGQVIVILASPVLTRLYTPSQIGILSVYTSLLGICTVAVSLRYEVAIPLPESDEDAVNLLSLALTLVAFGALCLAAVTVIGGRTLLLHVGYGGLAPYIWLLPGSLAAAGTYQALSFWAMRKRAFAALARTKVTQNAAQVASQVVLGVARIGTIGLILGDVCGRTAGSSTLATLAVRESRPTLRRVSWSGMRAMAKRYRRFPLLSSGSALLDAITLQVPMLLLAAFYGAGSAGLYALGQRVLAAPMSVIGTAVSNVYYSSLSVVARTEPERLQPLFLRMSKRLLLLGIGPAALAVVFAPRMFAVVFGHQWREAGEFLKIIAPMLLTQFVASPLGGTLDVLERQDLHLIREVIRQSLSLGALVGGRLLEFDVWHAVVLYAVAGTVGNLFYIGSTWYALRDESARASSAL